MRTRYGRSGRCIAGRVSDTASDAPIRRRVSRHSGGAGGSYFTGGALGPGRGDVKRKVTILHRMAKIQKVDHITTKAAQVPGRLFSTTGFKHSMGFAGVDKVE